LRLSLANIALLQVLDGFFEVETANAMADIYVWLRYSSTRQLTWQRNYNTQPRILSAAQVRNRLATTQALTCACRRGSAP
jgi:alpha-glucan,water dikinase